MLFTLSWSHPTECIRGFMNHGIIAQCHWLDDMHSSLLLALNFKQHKHLWQFECIPKNDGLQNVFWVSILDFGGVDFKKPLPFTSIVIVPMVWTTWILPTSTNPGPHGGPSHVEGDRLPRPGQGRYQLCMLRLLSIHCYPERKWIKILEQQQTCHLEIILHCSIEVSKMGQHKYNI